MNPTTEQNPNSNPNANSSQTQQTSNSRSPYAPFRAQPEHRETGRRMGTLTFGICLVAAGILLLLGVLVPDISLSMIAQACRLAPLVLVLLGVEILVSYFRNQGKALRYDGWGIFLTLLLVLGASSVSGGVLLYDQFGPANSRLTDQVEQQISTDLYQALSQEGNILSCETDLYLESPGPKATEFDYHNMTASDYLSLHLTLDNSPQTAEAFAAACQPVLEKINSLGLPSLHITLRNDSFRLDLDNPFSQSLSLAGLTQLVEDYREAVPSSQTETTEETVSDGELVPGSSQAA